MPDQTHRVRGSTRRGVYAADRTARAVITVGGFAVLAAVLGICVYLVVAVAPLFAPGSSGDKVASGSSPVRGASAVFLDEFARAAILVDNDGGYTAFLLGTGEVLSAGRLAPEGRDVTAWSRQPGTGNVALGFDDGSVALGMVGFDWRLLRGAELEDADRAMEIGAIRVGERGQRFVERVGDEEWRATEIAIAFGSAEPLKEGSGAVELIDYQSPRKGREYLVAARADGSAVFNRVRRTTPLGGGEPRTRFTSSVLGLEETPDHLFVTGDAGAVLAVWDDGRCVRFSPGVSGEEGMALVERLDVVGEGRSVALATLLPGSLTLFVVDDTGAGAGWFVAPGPDSGNPDGRALVRAWDIGATGGVTSVGTSPRGRSLAIGDDDGAVRVVHTTSRKRIASYESGVGAAAACAITPKDDGVLVVGADGRYELTELDPGDAEASWRSLFGRIHYEGQERAEFVYQSSSADDLAEVKISLTPLIFGTLKATVFAMLFAAPLGVLAAIYSSEFMSPRVHRTVKPAIEMMASLPSVVLGFVAAFVVAPYVRDWLPSVLVGFVVVPLVVMFAAQCWQLLPARVLNRAKTTTHLALVAGVFALALGVSGLAGPLFERTLFEPTRGDVLVLAGSYEKVDPAERPAWVGVRETMTPAEARRLRADGLYFQFGEVVRPVEPGDEAARAEVQSIVQESSLGEASIRRWLDGSIGGAMPGWVVALFPVAAVFVGVGMARLNRPFSSLADGLAPAARGAAYLARFGMGVGATLGVAVVAAWAMTAIGLDPRDSIFGPFSQRNTLVVGAIMGFAVVPIIYTLSDDAMRSVPAQLRSASLGCGATPWQTAVRVVLPVAASGIFSAVMIGLGRAVGETMIVLMATGSTPEMSWNVFGGFRTLSANIAIELPEAPKDSTHYRVLFLCGLVLFAMTFVINTTAEVVRQYYRRRNAGL